MLKKACTCLYALRSLKAAGLDQKDLVSVYCSLVRSVLEYASPVWTALHMYLQDLLEAVQKKEPWKLLVFKLCPPGEMWHVENSLPKPVSALHLRTLYLSQSLLGTHIACYNYISI